MEHNEYNVAQTNTAIQCKATKHNAMQQNETQFVGIELHSRVQLLRFFRKNENHLSDNSFPSPYH